MLKDVLSSPQAYLFTQGVFGALSSRQKLIAEYTHIDSNTRILDIGCGPGYVIDYMPDFKEYVGYDVSQPYIVYAQKKFGSANVKFLNKEYDEQEAQSLGTFDLILMNGLIHHLDDVQTVQLFNVVKRSLSPKGHLICMDGCFHEPQSSIAKWFLKNDRGQFVPTEEEYLCLTRTVFKNVKHDLKTEYMRIPYSLFIQDITL